jgi:flagellar biosynthesis GTPase FlhF
MDLSVIQEKIAAIEQTRQEIKVLNDMLKDSLTNDTTYQALEEEAKQFNDKRKQARETVTNQPHVQEIQMQIKDQKEKLKDLQELLSHYLLEYYNETKSNEVADHEGKARKVVINARLGSKKEE